MTNVAVIGAGLIGRAWSIVFARAGFSVALWDQFPQQTTQAKARTPITMKMFLVLLLFFGVLSIWLYPL